MNTRLMRAAPDDPTRQIAFDVLVAVLERRRSLEDALDAADPADGVASSRDRAAAHRLAATVLRRMGTLDAVLEPFLKKAPPERVRVALLMGAAQLLLLDTPAHAAVGTIVSLVKSNKLEPFAGLVNAVLRRVAQAGAPALDGLDQARLDVPPWLWSSWGTNARRIAGALGREAPLDITLAPGVAPPEGGLVLPSGSVRFAAGTRVASLPGYETGAFWVQDAAAALPARLLSVQPGERVADLCAAPGGKTAQLAHSGAALVAIERDASRLRRLRENLARLGLTVDTVQADATEWSPPAPLDAVLLDAPCSATGTVRRHPDVLRLRRAADPGSLAETQDRLIEAAARMLRPGGRLVYAVCSMQPEEGPERAANASRFGLAPLPFTEAELAFLPEARTTEGWLRTHPGLWPEQGGMDGFFAARFVRT